MWVRAIERAIRLVRRYGRAACIVTGRHVSPVGSWKSDHVEVVQENPEHLFSNIYHFFAPDAVWARLAHFKNKANWSLGFVGLGVL